MRFTIVGMMAILASMAVASCATNRTLTEQQRWEAMSANKGRARFLTREVTPAFIDTVWARARAWLSRNAPSRELRAVADTLETKDADEWHFDYRIAKAETDSLTVFEVTQSVEGVTVGGDNRKFLAAFLEDGIGVGTARVTRARARSSIFVELGGQAIVTSVNYESYVLRWFSIRAGVGSGIVGGPLAIPVGFNVRQLSDFAIEVGAGITWVDRWPEKLGDGHYIPSLSAAFRRDPAEGGFMYRIAVGNLWFPERDATELMFGIALGVSF